MLFGAACLTLKNQKNRTEKTLKSALDNAEFTMKSVWHVEF